MPRQRWTNPGTKPVGGTARQGHWAALAEDYSWRHPAEMGRGGGRRLYPRSADAQHPETYAHRGPFARFPSGGINRTRECPAPGLMEAFIPREDESHGSTEEVPGGASGAGDTTRD